MNYWFLLCNPNEWNNIEKYEVNNELLNLEEETWNVVRSRFENSTRKVKIGDKFILKVGEDKRTIVERKLSEKLEPGIYAIGEIISSIYDPDDDSYEAHDKRALIDIKVERNLFKENNIIKKEDAMKILKGKYKAQGSTSLKKEEYDEVIDFLENGYIKDEENREKTPKDTSNSIPIFDSHQTIYFGAPGSGKSHKIEKELLKHINDDNKRRVTFHPEYDYASFVGSYKPTTDNKGNITYEFVPQIFTEIYVNAWKNLDENYYLIIEEINRGNCAEIFGDIFQLLDRTDDGKSEYPINPSEELKKYLKSTLGENEGIASGKLILPPNLYILATMNTSDQSLFPMDSAFKRRWDWEYIPIEYNISESKHTIKIDSIFRFEWLDFLKKVNEKIRKNLNLGMDKCMGPFFIKSKKNVTLKDFINKVIFYLWNDVFKDENETIFNGITYEDFFPIEPKGKENVKKILKELGVNYSENHNLGK